MSRINPRLLWHGSISLISSYTDSERSSRAYAKTGEREISSRSHVFHIPHAGRSINVISRRGCEFLIGTCSSLNKRREQTVRDCRIKSRSGSLEVIKWSSPRWSSAARELTFPRAFPRRTKRETNHGRYFLITLYIRVFIRAHFYLRAHVFIRAHVAGPRARALAYVLVHRGRNEPGC